MHQQIRGGRKGRAEHQGLGQRPHNISKKTDRSAARASSDAGPELAGRESHAAMESPQALIAPMERGCPLKKYVWMIRGFNKSSSDDRPGPGICCRKYVEDEKAARSVRVWDRVPMKNKVGEIKTNARSVGIWGSAPIQKKRVPRRTSEDSPEERQLPTLPPGLAVPSAMTGLASLFGMGRGGSPSL